MQLSSAALNTELPHWIGWHCSDELYKVQFCWLACYYMSIMYMCSLKLALLQVLDTYGFAHPYEEIKDIRFSLTTQFCNQRILVELINYRQWVPYEIKQENRRTVHNRPSLRGSELCCDNSTTIENTSSEAHKTFVWHTHAIFSLFKQPNFSIVKCQE